MSADQDLAVCLDRDRMEQLVRVRIESAVQCAVRIQSGDVVARHTQNSRKTTADEDLAVWLNGAGREHVADGAEIERLVKPAVVFQPGDVVARYCRPPMERACEIAAHQNLAVRLHCDGIDRRRSRSD